MTPDRRSDRHAQEGGAGTVNDPMTGRVLEGRYRMIEVKGPGDRLQDNQKRWLAFCAEHGMPVEVCYVRWQGDADEAE